MYVYLFVFVIWVRVDSVLDDMYICVVGMYVFGGVLWWLCLHVESLGIIYVVLYHIKHSKIFIRSKIRVSSYEEICYLNFVVCVHVKPGHSRPQPLE